MATTMTDDTWDEGGISVKDAQTFSGRGKNWLFVKMKSGELQFSQETEGGKRSISKVSLKRLLAAGQPKTAE